MAESGLISMPTSAPEIENATIVDAAGQIRVCVTHCVMIVPTAHTQAWLQAFQDAADLMGWDLVVVGLDGEIKIPRPTETFAVLLDAAAMDRLAVDRFAIVSTGLISTAEAVSDMFDVSAGQRLMHASRILALGYVLPQAVTSHYRDADLLAGGAAFEAFEGVHVTVPALSHLVADTELRRSIESAFRIFESDEINIGVSAEWSAELFTYGSRTPDVVDGRVDVTGRQRPIVFGPYICLPPGRWRIQVKFAVNQDTARHNYRLEWGDMASYSVAPFKPDRPGYYDITSTNEWTYVASSEMQVAIAESSLGGEFLFQGARVERVQ